MKLFFLLLFPLMISCGSAAPASTAGTRSRQAIPTPKFSTVKVVDRHAHSTDSYTQGLLVEDGKFYESTGEYGRSKLRVIDIESGKIEREVRLDDRYFGEGLALYKDKLYQLTWMEGACLVYDKKSLKLLQTIAYQGEGWGIVAREDSLIISNGSSVLKVVDPENLRSIRTVTVRDDRGEVGMLNELEMIDGKLYANIYMSPIIAVINPDTGIVERYLDCSALPAQLGNSSGADVFNGIALDESTGKLYLTGKFWDTLFEVEIN